MTIQAKKDNAKNNPDWKAVKVLASQDSVPLNKILDALVAFKDKEYLNQAFEQGNVQAFAKIGHYYHPIGLIPKSMFEKYKLTLK